MQRIIDAQPESLVGAWGKPSGGAISRGLGAGRLGGGVSGGAASGGGGGGGAGGGGRSGNKSKDEILVTLEEDNGLLKLLVDVRRRSCPPFLKMF